MTKVELRVYPERLFFGRARLLPSREAAENSTSKRLGRSLALPIQDFLDRL